MKTQTSLQVFHFGILLLCNIALALALAVLAGVSGYLFAEEKSDLFTSPSDLVAAMPDPYNINLKWNNHATVEGGNLVECQLHPSGASLPAKEQEDFLILGFLDSEETTFSHKDLGAETVLTFRIHPYFGKCTKSVGITTGSVEAGTTEPEEPEGPLEEAGTDPNSASSDVKSIHQPANFAEAAPTDLTASLSAPTHVVLRWTEHAQDADGYLAEISVDPEKSFQVCGLLPPHTTSFRKTGLPPKTQLYFRVRAFVYGSPSNSVTCETGPENFASAATAQDKPSREQGESLPEQSTETK